jgi:tetratricopeptide (TPR) repeat protein
MRFLFVSWVILVLAVSCKTVQSTAIIENKTDTIQFTYLYSEGLKFKMLGNTQKAKEILKKCLEINKESSASAYQLSLMYFEENKLDSAKNYAEFCLKNKPDNEWYLINRAKIAQKLHENLQYNAIYKKLANLCPDNLNYSFELAVIYFNDAEYDESLSILDGIEETIGVDEDVSFLKNNVFYEQKRFDAIQAELLKLKVFYPDSVKYMDMLADFYLNTNKKENAFNLYKSILDIDSSNVSAEYGLAMLYAKSKNYLEGFNHLKKVLNDVEFDNSKKETVSNLYLEAPEKTFSNEQINSIYLGLLNENKVSVDILNDYMSYLFKLKQLTQTEKIAKFSIKIKPENYWGWDYLFQVLISQSRNEELNSFALKALEYYPNQAEIYFNIGYSFFMMKKYSDAVTYLERGRDYVIDKKALEMQFLLYLAESYHSVGKNKKSDEYFESYLKIDSTNAYLMNNYAFYLVNRSEQIDKAAIISMKSIEIEPFNSSFLDTYSWILYKKEEYSQALNYIERSYRYGGNKNAIIIEHYGDILFKLGHANEALEKWQEAYSLNKNNTQLQKKIETYQSEK